ncbi:MAG TPA: hypothetical protein VEF53_09420, partial [Patescibacteria group bacterium]|nr:hypothetical protein [Patescibacteria group bacterium]
MSENKQNQGGMGKGIIKLISKHKIAILLILTIVSGLIFFNTYSNLKSKYNNEVDADKQAFLNELTGQKNDSVSTGTAEETTVTEEVAHPAVLEENGNAANGSINAVAPITQELKVLHDNDYYTIEVLGGEITEEEIIVNIQYTVKNISNAEYGNDMIY